MGESAARTCRDARGAAGEEQQTRPGEETHDGRNGDTAGRTVKFRRGSRTRVQGCWYRAAPVRSVLLSLTVLVPLGCSSPGAWQRARTADTADGYRAYLAQHPKGEEVEAAEERLRALEFEEASRVQTVLAWKRFLERHREGPELPAARARLEGLRFAAASQRNSLEGWRLFLADHPEGAHAGEARTRIAALEDVLAAQAHDATTLEVLSRTHAGDARGQQARVRLDAQRFAEASRSGARALLTYLSEFPEGQHRLEAQAALLEWELEGLLVSGEWDAAQAAWARSPLKGELSRWAALSAQAEAERAVRGSKDLAVQRALPDHSLRPTDELVRALGAVDPLERWRAAEELGEVVSVRVLDPLLDAFRRSRNLVVRDRAFLSLQRVLKALPPAVAEHQLAVREETLRQQAATPELELALAVLQDLGGRHEQAAAAYRRAWEAERPDPAVLLRWVRIRRERGQHHAAAVAARQLALWAKETASRLELQSGPVLPVGVAREACAAAEASRFAREALAWARTGQTEFPEDVLQFSVQADEAARLAEARLKDAELRFRGEQPGARLCRDAEVTQRLQRGREERRQAVAALLREKHPLAAEVQGLARARDPEPSVRAAAGD